VTETIVLDLAEVDVLDADGFELPGGCSAAAGGRGCYIDAAVVTNVDVDVAGL